MRTFLQTLCFSKTLQAKRRSHQVAYTALLTAVMVVINAVEIKMGGVQFSLTMFTAMFAGLYLGGLSGFLACFLGDMIGFFLHPFGEYSPWIGIATGLMALLTALFLLLPRTKERLWLYIGLSCICIFVCCTCGITTLYLNKVWYTSMTFWECLTMRLFVQGQVFNSIANSVFALIVLPMLVKVKPLSIKL